MRWQVHFSQNNYFDKITEMNSYKTLTFIWLSIWFHPCIQGRERTQSGLPLFAWSICKLALELNVAHLCKILMQEKQWCNLAPWTGLTRFMVQAKVESSYCQVNNRIGELCKSIYQPPQSFEDLRENKRKNWL